MTVIRRWKSESFLSFFDERNERIKGGEGRIEKQNWNKGRRRSAKRNEERERNDELEGRRMEELSEDWWVGWM